MTHVETPEGPLSLGRRIWQRLFSPIERVVEVSHPAPISKIIQTDDPAIKHWLGLIDSVHLMPPHTGNILLLGDDLDEQQRTDEILRKRDAIGLYRQDWDPSILIRSHVHRSINATTFIHEVGHALDYALVPKDPWSCWSDTSHPLAVRFQELVAERNTRLCPRCRTSYRSGYVQSNVEWFARTYVQWIAWRSLDARLRHATWIGNHNKPLAQRTLSGILAMVRPYSVHDTPMRRCHFHRCAYWTSAQMHTEIAPLFDKLLEPYMQEASPSPR